MPADAGFEALSRFPLSTIEGALARAGLRPRGEGVALPGLAPLWKGDGRIAGRAVTVVMSVDEGFPHGRKENAEWWRHVEAAPEPKVVVAQVLGANSAAGAVSGVLTANILRALGCQGFVTDGYVRDADEIARAGLLTAARGVTLRHGNPHVVRFGEPVEVLGMKVAPGDAVLAGGEGALAFPAAWLSELPSRIREVEARVGPVLEFCRGKRRTAAQIAEAIAKHMPPAGTRR
jgi:regulator of RNase E activity RraA